MSLELDSFADVELPYPTACDVRSPSNSKKAAYIVTENAIKRIVGKRLVSARLLSGIDQQQAAERLGLANSSQLSKIESGFSAARLWLLQKAALLYGVSMDFLTGLSDYPERDCATVEQLAIMRSVRQQLWEATQERLKDLVIAGEDSAALLAHLGRLRNDSGDAWRAMCEAELDFGAGMETSPELQKLDEELRSLVMRLAKREFAGSLSPLKQVMGTGIEHAEEANRYLKRRKALRAHHYLDDAEQGSPSEAIAQTGLRGLLEIIKSPEPEPLQ